jgi:hypothetical protein
MVMVVGVGWEYLSSHLSSSFHSTATFNIDDAFVFVATFVVVVVVVVAIAIIITATTTTTTIIAIVKHHHHHHRRRRCHYQLCAKIHLSGLKVVRIVAKSREGITNTDTDHLALHRMVTELAATPKSG